MKRQNAALAAAILAALFAVGLLACPLIGEACRTRHHALVLARYEAAAEEGKSGEAGKLRESARAYNRLICGGTQGAGFDAASLRRAQEDYGDQLDLLGDGVMGSVEIPAIGVELPIFHGTDETSLRRGAGHLTGSSLPVGGPGTHTVITAHSGMASGRMFSDLPELREGDLFFLRVLGERLCYRVDRIRVTRPEETEALRVERDRDLCTLVTCTPLGVNTHRLLVRGERVPDPVPDGESVQAPAGQTGTRRSVWRSAYGKGVLAGLVPVSAAAALLMLRHRNGPGDTHC